MPRHQFARMLLFAGLAMSAACGNGGATNPSPASYHATVNDAPDDAIPRDGKRVFDLVSASVDVVSEQVSVMITFAPDTGATDGIWGLYIDTDENASTGDPYGISGGIDYAVIGVGAIASVSRYVSATAGVALVGTVPVTISGNTIRATVPLRYFNDDGRFTFSVLSGWALPDLSDGAWTDVMPEFDKLAATR